MTGAVSCLSGIEELGIIIHGASGCYFYPATILHRKIHCTFLIEEDIIFGAGERLRELINSLKGEYQAVAVVNTCTPAIIGEEIEDFGGNPEVMVIDAPGFMGSYEDGFCSATRSLIAGKKRRDTGVLVDGLSPFDPFYSGNCLEVLRLLARGGVADPILLSACPLSGLSHLPKNSISTNPDLQVGTGKVKGTFLGIDETVTSILNLRDVSSGGSADQLIREAEAAKDDLARVCDKYLQRFDPPSVAIFGGFAYASFAAGLLEENLDASITCIGSRNPAGSSRFLVAEASSLSQVNDLIDRDPPDIVLGSSFEHTLAPSAVFVPFTFPIRGMIRLRARPLVGIQGTLGLIEDVLNRYLDRKKKDRTPA
jgi:nitrogenase molybdenum-iron protein alpha/beta subunit